jgi:hypothetical protein
MGVLARKQAGPPRLWALALQEIPVPYVVPPDVIAASFGSVPEASWELSVWISEILGIGDWLHTRGWTDDDLIILPYAVSAIGGGDYQRGCDVLDDWITFERTQALQAWQPDGAEAA